MQMGALPLGNVIQPQNIYATLLEISKAMSLSTPEKFATDPTTVPPPQPQPPIEVQVEQIRLQGNMQEAQIKAQSEQQRMQAQSQADAQRIQIEAQLKAQIEEQKLAFEKWKVEFQAQVDLALEQMKLGKTEEIELRRIGSTESIKAAELQRADMERENGASEKESDKREMEEIKQAIAQFARLKTSIEKVKDKTGRMVGARVTYDDGSVENVTIQ